MGNAHLPFRQLSDIEQHDCVLVLTGTVPLKSPECLFIPGYPIRLPYLRRIESSFTQCLYASLALF